MPTLFFRSDNSQGPKKHRRSRVQFLLLTRASLPSPHALSSSRVRVHAFQVAFLRSLRAILGADVYASGVIVNEFLLEDAADWSSLPLPNNQP